MQTVLVTVSDILIKLKYNMSKTLPWLFLGERILYTSKILFNDALIYLLLAEI